MSPANEKRLRRLVALQDIDGMIQETTAEQQLGFATEGLHRLQEMRAEVAKDIFPPFLRTYEQLRKRYKRAVVPVKNEICLGCFVKLPTSLSTKGKENISIFRCENCGRILYWVD